MSRIGLIFLALGAALSQLAAEPALRPGEAFTFRVTWGLLGSVGEIKVNDVPATEPGTVAINVTTRSAGLARVIYPFDGTGQSFFDQSNGRLLRATAATKSRGDSTDASIVFDYPAAEAHYTDHLEPKRNTTLALPEQPPLELITSLIHARDFNLKPGDVQAITVLFDDEFYELNLRAGDYEKVRTADGKVRALLITPEPIGKPKGMFKRGGAIRVWLADDAERLPVRFEVSLKIGTAVALLTAHSETNGAEGSTAVETATVWPTTQDPHTTRLLADRL